MQTTGKISVKKYKCSDCGNTQLASTNHYGEFYDLCNNCSWKSSLNKIKVHVCLEKLPDGWEKPEPWKFVTLNTK